MQPRSVGTIGSPTPEHQQRQAQSFAPVPQFPFPAASQAGEPSAPANSAPTATVVTASPDDAAHFEAYGQAWAHITLASFDLEEAMRAPAAATAPAAQKQRPMRPGPTLPKQGQRGEPAARQAAVPAGDTVATAPPSPPSALKAAPQAPAARASELPRPPEATSVGSPAPLHDQAPGASSPPRPPRTDVERTALETSGSPALPEAQENSTAAAQSSVSEAWQQYHTAQTAASAAERRAAKRRFVAMRARELIAETEI